MYNLNSKIKDVLKNPIGHDLFFNFLNEMNLIKYKDFIFNPLTLQMKLKRLMKLPNVNQELLEMICQKMNHYSGEVLTKPTGKIKKAWWKEAVCYQIYPRSFYDSNSDGMGDLQGIIKKLEYLKDLGVDVIWLSPIYDSPNHDNGYDIRDYQKILSDFGSLEDFDELLQTAHSMGMKLIMDLVINHTSDEHQWFKLSRLNDDLYKDFYIWRDKPNNWTSMFEGPAWTYDSSREASYLHIFTKEQPDLNWENPDVKQHIYDMVNWWLEKGVDGFRLDVINFISKEAGLPDGNQALGALTNLTGLEHYMYGPKVHDYLRELNEQTFSRYDVMTVGECPGIGYEMSKYFTHENRRELNMIFNFDHLYSEGRNKWDQSTYNLEHLKQTFFKFQQLETVYWNALFINNHDTPRMLYKILDGDDNRIPLSKMLALMMLSLRGTPYIYQGQEFGMMNKPFEHISQFRDVESLNVYKELLKEHSESEALEILNRGSRDHSRLPMSWSDQKNAGFSDVTPWIKNSDDYEWNNVAVQDLDQNSILNFYRKMIQFRKEHDALIYGKTIPYKPNDKGTMIYKRILDKEEYLIIINLEPRVKDISLSMKNHVHLLSTYASCNLLYKPYEGRIYKKVKSQTASG